MSADARLTRSAVSRAGEAYAADAFVLRHTDVIEKEEAALLRRHFTHLAVLPEHRISRLSATIPHCIAISAAVCSPAEARERGARLVLEAEGTKQDVHDAPNGHHDEEADDAGDNELPSFLALFLIFTVEEKELEYAPEEQQECYREDKRDERAVYDANEESDEADDLHN